MKTHTENGIRRLVVSTLIGAVVGVLACTVILLIMAAILSAVTVPAAVITPLSLAAAALGAFVGGLVAARLSRERGLLYGAGSGLLLFLLVMAAGFALFPDTRGALLWLKLLLLVGGGALGGVLGVNLKRRR